VRSRSRRRRGSARVCGRTAAERANWSRDDVGRPRRATRRQVALGIRARAGAARRRDRRRRALGQGRAGRARRRDRAVAIPSARTRATLICGAGSVSELPLGARVGTSSLRRAAQLRALRPDLEVVELRGNVDTRLRKLAAGEATRSCWRSRASDASAARPRRRRARSSSSPRPARARSPVDDRLARRRGGQRVARSPDGCLRRRRAGARARARRLVQTAVGAHAPAPTPPASSSSRMGRAARRLSEWMPIGCGTATGSARGSPSGCSPRGARRLLARAAEARMV
jgi:hypothetical protein